MIVSPDEMNRRLQTVQIVPLTSQFRDLPTRIKIKANPLSGLTNDSYAALDQLKTVDKKRLGNSIGNVSDLEAQIVCDTLLEMYHY
ncbi:PemK-like protein [Bacteroidales bacterium Barb6XT]|nr:PemK-like protein [Bacteroidales bacterium Barb6XT]